MPGSRHCDYPDDGGRRHPKQCLRPARAPPDCAAPPNHRRPPPHERDGIFCPQADSAKIDPFSRGVCPPSRRDRSWPPLHRTQPYAEHPMAQIQASAKLTPCPFIPNCEPRLIASARAFGCQAFDGGSYPTAYRLRSAAFRPLPSGSGASFRSNVLCAPFWPSTPEQARTRRPNPPLVPRVICPPP